MGEVALLSCSGDRIGRTRCELGKELSGEVKYTYISEITSNESAEESTGRENRDDEGLLPIGEGKGIGNILRSSRWRIIQTSNHFDYIRHTAKNQQKF